jgi:hypothetical protein
VLPRRLWNCSITQYSTVKQTIDFRILLYYQAVNFISLMYCTVRRAVTTTLYRTVKPVIVVLCTFLYGAVLFEMRPSSGRIEELRDGHVTFMTGLIWQ